VQVSGSSGLLAGCGWSALRCCRHVDVSTVVHRATVPSTHCPLATPAPSPGCPEIGGATILPCRRDRRQRRSWAVWRARGGSRRAERGVLDAGDRRPGIRADTGRSPQPVHIPGDNLPRSRRGSPCETAGLRVITPSGPSLRHRNRLWTGTGPRRSDDMAVLRTMSGRVGAHDMAVLRTAPRPGAVPRLRRACPSRLRGTLRAPLGTTRLYCRARLLMRAVSSVTWVYVARRSLIRLVIFLTACMTVV